MNFSSFFGKTGQQIILALMISFPVNVSAITELDPHIWSYHQERDKLTNLNYSYTRSPMPRRELYDNIRLEIVCKENKLQFVIDTNSLITSQGSAFDFEYQIDKNQPVTIQMRTFSDSKRKGYSDEHAKRIADDILTGKSIFVRVDTIIQRVLSAAIPLEDAAQPINKVFADCGITAPGSVNGQPAYSLADFERDFGKLSLQQQQQVLSKIKIIMQEMR